MVLDVSAASQSRLIVSSPEAGAEISTSISCPAIPAAGKISGPCARAVHEKINMERTKGATTFADFTGFIPSLGI
jgi:hypothetical protein